MIDSFAHFVIAWSLPRIANDGDSAFPRHSAGQADRSLPRSVLLPKCVMSEDQLGKACRGATIADRLSPMPQWLGILTNNSHEPPSGERQFFESIQLSRDV
jgi:hypothetical protein